MCRNTRRFCRFISLPVMVLALVFSTDSRNSSAVALESAVVRVAGSHSVVTATVIHRSEKYGTYALTCRHGDLGGAFTWEVGGRSTVGSWRVASADSDLALLWHRSAGLPCDAAEVAQNDVQSGELVTSLGFDNPNGAGGFSHIAGSVARRWSDKAVKSFSLSRDSQGRTRARTETGVRRTSGPGRSGGGLFNRNGELLGVCSEQRGDHVVFVSLDVIVGFLNSAQQKGFAPFWAPKSPNFAQYATHIAAFEASWGFDDLNSGRKAEALRRFESALAWNAGEVRAMVGAARSLEGLNRRDEATAMFRKALEGSQGDLSVRAAYAKCLLTAGKSSEAQAEFAVLVKADPKSAEAALGLADSLYDAGRYADSIAAYDAALVVRPTSAEAQFNRANALKVLDRRAEAIQGYRQATVLAPKAAWAWHALAAALLIDAQSDSARLAQATESARTACELSDWKNAAYRSTFEQIQAKSAVLVASARN